MADGFIVRKGGKATEQTIAPSILDFSTASATSIKFKLRNNDEATATLVYRFGTVTGDGESISVAANTTTSEITFTVPTITAPTKLFVTANAVGKVKSEVAEQEFPIFVVYTAATGGTTNEYDLDGKRYKSHTFTSSDDFVVTTVGDNIDDRNKVDYLIIAGGGGGSAGGGGAGGFQTTVGTQGGGGTLGSKVTVTATTFGVVVGAGGNGATAFPGGNTENGTNGNNSSALGVTASLGGGRGVYILNTAGTGGSGGGGGSNDGTGTAGAGTTNQGFGGGSGGVGTSGGGGGGASQVGSSASGNNGGNGGDGLANLLRTGSNETRAGGGGGSGTGTPGSGGSGGGGAGGNVSDATSGTTNTGSGGGGIYGSFPGGNGGSGIVVVRYEIAPTS
jgi:hypothetical protein